jgi:RimJ/RimL family protein N-acetyltransferase
MFHLETERLIISEFTPDMAEAVHRNSLDEDNRRFVPDEVFETVEAAAETIAFLMTRYGGTEGPLVYPVLLKTGETVGYVQAVPLDAGEWEIGYHIAKAYTNRGYATEAVRAFLPVILPMLHLETMAGVCLADNFASRRVLEKCGFTKIFEGVGLYQGEDRPICRCQYHL